MSATAVAVFAAGALLAGLISTIAGLGGGVFMVALLSTVLPPHLVVTLTAPVIFCGSLGRAVNFRRYLDLRAAALLAAGVVPAAIAGALALPAIPARGLKVALGCVLLGLVARELVRRRGRSGARAWRIPRKALPAIGALYGGAAGTVGAGGAVTAPLLRGYGLAKERLVATISTTGTVANTVKIPAFAATGLLAADHLPAIAIAVVAVTAGNAVGKRLLETVISDRAFEWLLLAVLTAVAVSLLGGQ